MADDKAEKKAPPAEFKEPVIKEVEETTPPTDDYKTKLYSLNKLYNYNGASKNLTLDELNALSNSRKQGTSYESGTHTAREIVRSILSRAGINDGPQKDFLENIFTHAMEDNIPDPVLWQNPHSPLVSDNA